MGCSSSEERERKNINQTPLKINMNEIKSIIFDFEMKFRIPITTLPFFRLGDLFLQSLIKNQNSINKYIFIYDGKKISDYFYRNDEVKVLNIKTQSIEIRVIEKNN